MTMQPKKVVVADDVLGKILKIISDLTSRLIEGSLDIYRCMFFLGLAKEAIPETPWVADQKDKSGAMYVLEYRWQPSKGESPAGQPWHLEYLTMTLDKTDEYYPSAGRHLRTRFEIFFSKDHFSEEEGEQREDVEEELLRNLGQRFNSATATKKGPKEMVRLYRVHGRSTCGRSSVNQNESGSEWTRSLDLVFTLVPVCDFNEHGHPVLPLIKNDRRAKR